MINKYIFVTQLIREFLRSQDFLCNSKTYCAKGRFCAKPLEREPVILPRRIKISFSLFSGSRFFPGLISSTPAVIDIIFYSQQVKNSSYHDIYEVFEGFWP